MRAFLGWCAFGVALSALLAAGTYGGLVLLERLERPYAEACRAAGGVPVYGRGGLNCGSKDGGWIDVRN